MDPQDPLGPPSCAFKSMLLEVNTAALHKRIGTFWKVGWQMLFRNNTDDVKTVRGKILIFGPNFQNEVITNLQIIVRKEDR